MAKSRKFSVGQRIWRFDENRRVYPKGGGMSVRPIFEKYFIPFTVYGIKDRSYLIDYPGTGNWEKTASAHGFSKAEKLFCTDDEKADRVFLNDNQLEISQAVRVLNDVGMLKKIAELIGFQLR